MSVHISLVVLKKIIWYSNDLGWFLLKSSMIYPDLLLPGSVSLKQIRIRFTKMKGIHTDPDQKHWIFLFTTTVYSNALLRIGSFSVNNGFKSISGSILKTKKSLLLILFLTKNIFLQKMDGVVIYVRNSNSWYSCDFCSVADPGLDPFRSVSFQPWNGSVFWALLLLIEKSVHYQLFLVTQIHVWWPAWNGSGSKTLLWY